MQEFCEISDQVHDQFMQNHKKEHFMQCSLWSKIKASSGWKGKTVGLFVDGNLVASSLLLFRHIPVLNSFICYAPRGFVIDFDDLELLSSFTDHLKDYCKNHNVCYIMIDPDLPYQVINAKGELIQSMPQILDQLTSLGYSHQGFTMSFDGTQPRFTFRLSLKDTKENIFANYSKIIRSSMNNAERIGIVCHKEQNVDKFFDIIQDTAVRNDFVERDKDYYESVLTLFGHQNMATCYSATYLGQAHLEAIKSKAAELAEEKQKCYNKLTISPNDTKSKNRISQIETQEEKQAKTKQEVEQFIQDYPEGLVLSSGITINTAHRCWLVYGGNRSLMRDVGANYAIKKFEIEDDIDKGFEFVDFFGTIGDTKENSEHQGIHEFKKRFSGNYYEFPGEFHLVLKPFHYTIWTKLAPTAKNWMRKLKRKQR